MIIDCISDLHGYYPELEGGDLLIVAGDLTATDHPWEYVEFGIWVNRQKYRKKIIIAGNHDNVAQKADPFIDPGTDEWIYLCDSGTEFESLKIWGSPWTKTFPGMNPECKAFTCETEDELFEKFKLIPADVDILITHSPPYGILDKIDKFYSNRSCGSMGLRGLLEYSIRPYLHVFGHVHESHGVEEVYPCRNDKLMKSVNASYVDECYDPVNKPIRVIL